MRVIGMWVSGLLIHLRLWEGSIRMKLEKTQSHRVLRDIDRGKKESIHHDNKQKPESKQSVNRKSNAWNAIRK
jgi:hypothetical protein